MNTVTDLFDMLCFGKHGARSADELHARYGNYSTINANGVGKIPLASFKRKLRKLASEARHQGTRIIGDDAGYYIAMNNEEWTEYKRTRFAALKEELESFASCERLSVRDMIKEVYCVNVENPNYELSL